MTTLPDPPPPGDEVNPYAAPRSAIDPFLVESDADLTEAEATRRAYLSHEASVQSLGSLHYLGAALCGLVVFGLIGALVGTGGPPNPGQAFVPFLALAIYVGLTALNVALGVGLNRLQVWARWTEIVFIGMGLAGSIFGMVVVLVAGQFIPAGLAIYGVTALIQGYILWLLLSPKGAKVFSPGYRAIIERTPHIRYRTNLLLRILLIFVATLFVLGLALYLISRRG